MKNVVIVTVGYLAVFGICYLAGEAIGSIGSKIILKLMD